MYYICSANIKSYFDILPSALISIYPPLPTAVCPIGASDDFTNHRFDQRHPLPNFNMCGCTLYDSPTCGHSWISMSQPCGFLSDLLSCPNRQTYQTLIAPPYTCPQCNGGFADRETIEMVQGPWGCNQMIRSHVGGSHAIPGSWGNAPFVSTSWGAGLGMGMAMNSNMPLVPSRGMVPVNGYGYDQRLGGPYGSRPAICSGYGSFDRGMMVDDGFMDDYRYRYDGRHRRRHESSSRYKYHHSSKPATNCTVM